MMKFIILLFMLSTQVCLASPNILADKPSHHTHEGFRNYPLVENTPNLGFGFYWKRFVSSFIHPDIPDHHVLPEREAIALYQELINENTITWLGQSTLLIKINGATILTDPFFSQLASPLPIGPERFVKPGIAAESLPKIDILLVSHNHYDHLDESFIEMLPNKQSVQVVVPLELGAFFEQRGYANIHQLDWYESIKLGDLRFTALPTVHYSGRSMGDKNKSLWCSWAISSPVGKYFFIGDSAYSPTLFKEIGDKFSSFDLAMVTIGTYGNRKYGVNNHTTPEEAVMIGQEINAGSLMGIHWGTIDLSDEPPFEPPVRFREAAAQVGYNAEAVWLLKIGETRSLPRH